MSRPSRSFCNFAHTGYGNTLPSSETVTKDSSDTHALRRGLQLIADSIITNETMGEVKARVRLAAPIEAYEIVQAVRLWLGNAVCLDVRGIAHQSRATVEGCLPAVSFGRVMARNRFKSILSNLHFVNYNGRDAIRDKAWNVRPIVNVLEQTFRDAWKLTPHLSLDEGVCRPYHGAT